MVSPTLFKVFSRVLVVVTFQLLLQQSHSAIVNAKFEKVPVVNTFLERFATGIKANSHLRCMFECIGKTTAPPMCIAFSYNDGTCDLYKSGNNQIHSSSQHAFLLQVRDTFTKFSVQNQLSSYYMSSTKKGYTDAKAHCKGLGGYLLHFDSPDEYAVVTYALSGVQDIFAEFWWYVGANDIQNEGQWVAEKDNKPLDANNWRWMNDRPQANAPNSNCMMLSPSFPHKGRDIACTFLACFICKRDP